MTAPMKTIHITTLEGAEIPTNINGLINTLLHARLDAPLAYRDWAEVDFSPRIWGDEGDCDVRMVITYDRPMTPEEIETERLRDEANRLAFADGWRPRRPWSEVPDLYFLLAKGGAA